MRQEIEIAGRRIGAGHPAYIVAEMSANHGHRIEHAYSVIEAAARCGADAVKIQTYTADTLTIDCDGAPFCIDEGSPWAGRKLHDLYREAATPWEWQPLLKAHADRVGIVLFSTPFDRSAVDLLESMRVPAHKVASFEIVDLELIRTVAATGKPVILSTGMATLDEIADAVATVAETGNDQLVLLECTSAYPAPIEQMNLRTIPDLAKRFGLPVGLSDHTLGTVVPVTSVALGACLIEKHVCLSREEGGPDSGFSLEPAEFGQLVSDVRAAEAALGEVHYGPTDAEGGSSSFRRSLFVVEDVAIGERLTRDNVRAIRPGHGLPPKALSSVLGHCASVAIARGTPLSWNLIDRIASSQ